MRPLNLADVTAYVEQNIGAFHAKRLEKLEALQLTEVIKRKNPYLFKAKGVGTAQDLVKIILDAYLSSQEETIFGEFLEGLAIYICEQVYGGRKSFVEGIDLEFERDGILYCVAIKAGPNWGNSSQIMRMRQSFRQAQRLGHRAKERNETFLRLYDQVVNRFVAQFMQKFFNGDLIDWVALVRFTSST